MLVPTKKWWESTTLWFNTLGAVLVVAEYMTTLDLSETVMQIVVGILVLGNYILRYKTKQPITFTGKSSRYVEDGRV